ncbi:hypothetical protein [Actinoallomurus rhizosphaericola]|uniref:hypothetical protein n=1 Tax=Actinoallomurus rhizosphaericola TaxID=2952536 RepID=UPI0020922F45|nr:hypothetical protein [Actinoallomurus rhizosphaericola]MCO5996212.1 hypothetical protein [Actinoallomurus rhizosphaericola]
MLKTKYASLGLVVSAAAGVLLTSSPANAQPDLAGYWWSNHHRHYSVHRHRSVNLNSNRPRIFIRIFIYNRNNNIAIARNEQAQRERQRQLERQRLLQQDRAGDTGGGMARRSDLTPAATGTDTAPVGAAARQVRPQVAGGSGVARDPGDSGASGDSGGAPARQSASAEQGAGSSEWQTP